MRLGLMSCAFPPTPKPRPQPSSTDIPILLELGGQAGFGPVPTGRVLVGRSGRNSLVELHTCMKIRDKLEAKVLAGDAEKLALTSQPSLGDTWLILGAHTLPSPPAAAGQNVPGVSHLSKKASWDAPSPSCDPRAVPRSG